MTVTSGYNSSTATAAREVQKNQDRANDATMRLATGSKFIKASENSSGAAIAASLKSKSSLLTQASINSGNGISVVQVATGALNNIKELLTKMQSLAGQAQSGDTDEPSKALINLEYTQLRDQVTTIATRTRWNGQAILTGGPGPAIGPANGTTTAQAVSGTTLVANGFAAGAITTTGFVQGSALSASMIPNGATYNIGINVGGQTFQCSGFNMSTITSATAAVPIEFVSTTDSANTITLTTSATPTGLATASTLLSGIESFLGIGTGLASAQAVPASLDAGVALNGFVPNDSTGVGSISASSSTLVGQYGISYSSATKQLHVSWATGSENVDLTNYSDGAQVINCPLSGLSLNLGSGFLRGGDIGQTVVGVQSGTSVDMSFLTGELATDTTTVTFAAATGAALGIDTSSVGTAQNATQAGVLLTAAFQTINQIYSQLGAQEGRLQSTIDNVLSTRDNYDAARHNYEDVDISENLIEQQLASMAAEMGNISITKSLQLNQQLLDLYKRS